MNLYTVWVIYEDFTVSIEQYQTDSPKSAFEIFLKTAEALKDYDRDRLLHIFHEKKENISLLHLAWMKGVWNINFWTPWTWYNPKIAIFGWCIVQTDQNWAIRIS